jgi:hypothetical protein
MGRFIGINQRISLQTLDELVTNLFQTKEIDKEFIKEKLASDFVGENRLRKAYSIFSKLLNQSLSLIIKKNLLESEVFNKLSNQEKHSIYLCIISLCYPIVFDIIESIYSNFKIESNCKSIIVLDKLKSLYGSNRSTENAFYSILRFFEEIQIITKTRPGLYLPANTLIINNQFTIDFSIYTFLLNKKSKSISMSELSVQPWFSIFSFDNKSFNTNLGSLLQWNQDEVFTLKEQFNTNQ